ncbi:MAG TPA: transporter substrate-binding domain-containing protein [Candidatus Sulfotelmatobacter sp.]|jgi:hypothetical protein|nr:transporter substrate-binding domain-containing protein [Candidatus Sulfotelmatobacter sp.]
MIRRLVTPLLMAAALLSLSRPASAEHFIIGVEAIDYMPHYGVKPNGEYQGFARALFDAYAADRGHQIEYRPLPVNRLFHELLEGRLDFKYPDNAFWQTELKTGKTVAYSDPVVNYIDGVLVLPENKGKPVDTIRTLGTVRGFTAFDWLDRLKSGATALEENPSFSGLMFQAMNKRIDGAYANVAVANNTLDGMQKPGALIFDPGLPHTRSSYKLSTLKHPEIIADFNAWMKSKPELVAKLKADWAVEKGVE